LRDDQLNFYLVHIASTSYLNCLYNIDINYCTILFHLKCNIAATLKHVAKTVAHVDLSDHIIQVVYTIFDENSELIFINRNTLH